jgi:quaternary ammonium compound-resistance protein SugE
MSVRMAWIYVFTAAVFEIIWAVGLKWSKGFTVFWPSVITIAAYVMSLVLLSAGVKTLPVGTAYAVWTGAGVAGTAVLGIIYFNEPRDAARIGCILLILAGVVGLKLTTKS